MKKPAMEARFRYRVTLGIHDNVKDTYMSLSTPGQANDWMELERNLQRHVAKTLAEFPQ